MNDEKFKPDPSEIKQTGFEQKIIEVFAARDLGLAIATLKEIDILLTGKAECEFANKNDLAQLEHGLKKMFKDGKAYVFYLSDGGLSRLILEQRAIMPSSNFSKEIKEKWEKIK